jgi:hyperosmotically inducible protein
MRTTFLEAALLAGLGLAGCQDRSTGSSHAPAASPKLVEQQAPDNTRVNERDRSGATVTPLDQSNEENDLKITQDLRQRLVNDDALSFDGKNVKIITSGGVVTLRGPVKDAAEKQMIESRARAVSGVANVDDQLEVTTEAK